MDSFRWEVGESRRGCGDGYTIELRFEGERLRIVERYEVGDEAIGAFGNFWSDRWDNDSHRVCTDRVGRFDIARTFSDEDDVELLACLDRFERE